MVTAQQAREMAEKKQDTPIEEIIFSINVMAERGCNYTYAKRMSAETKEKLIELGYRITWTNIDEYKIEW